MFVLTMFHMLYIKMFYFQCTVFVRCCSVMYVAFLFVMHCKYVNVGLSRVNYGFLVVLNLMFVYRMWSEQTIILGGILSHFDLINVHMCSYCLTIA